MALVGSRLYLLGGSLGLLGHALLDVVHGEGDGLRRGKGKKRRRFASSRDDSAAVELWVRFELKSIQMGDGRIGELGSSVVSEVRSMSVGRP